MRIAAIADVHGNVGALRAVLTHIKRVLSPDLIVNLGDHVSGPLQPRETADLLMSTLQIAIRGNHDRQLLEGSSEMGSVDRYAAEQLDEIHFSWLRRLTATAWIENEIFLCHGTPVSDLEYFLENPNERGSDRATKEQVADRAGDCPASLILCGHSHTPRTVRLEDGRLIVNPGSVGIPIYGGDLQCREPCASYAVLDRAAEWRVAFFQVKYDGEKAARIAESLGHRDWAHVLSGRLRK
jgi:putative phosphoesterase